MWQKHDLKNVACNFFVMENRVVQKPKGIQMKVSHTVTLRTDKGTELLVDNVRGLYLGLRLCYQRPLETRLDPLMMGVFWGVLTSLKWL